MKGKWLLKISFPHYECTLLLFDKVVIIWNKEMLKGLWLKQCSLNHLKICVLSQIFADN